MSKLDKDQVIADFIAAYEKANGKAPEIEAKGGWYTVDGGKNMRLAQLKEMGESLGGNNATSAKAEKKAAPAKSEKKSTSQKATTKKLSKKKSATKGFSVKTFWADKITDENEGSILPR